MRRAIVPALGLLLITTAACAPRATRASTDGPDAAARLRWRQQVMTDSVRAVLARGLADSAYPAAWAVIGTADGIYTSLGVGRVESLDTTWLPVTDSTLWDLASLTKVVGTTSAVLQLVAEGRVELDAPATKYLPRWRAARAEEVTIRHLLSHSAGLPAWRPLYKEAWSAEEAIAQVYATGPDTTPGRRYVYSDLGFILLGEVVREVSGLPLDSYLLSRVFLPADMRETRYLPSALWRSRTAPTEFDPWRQRHVRGEVHDENAFQLGQVSGHAGLFSSARDLTRFAQLLLRGGWVRTADSTRREILPSSTLRDFRQRQPLGEGLRALGWETPTGVNSAGQRLSDEAFGHTGFTGTSLWVDPGRDVFVLLLTNRVNPTRQRTGIGRVRPELADAVVGALEATAGQR